MSTDNQAQQPATITDSTGMSTTSGGGAQTEGTGDQSGTGGQSNAGRLTGQVDAGSSSMPAMFQGKVGVVGYSFTHNEAIVRPDKGLYAVGALTGKRYKRYGVFIPLTDEARASLNAGGWTVDNYPGLNR